MHPQLALLRLVTPFALPLALAAQIVNPADKQRPPSQGPGAQGAPLVVEGRQVSDLREEDRIGSYGQPEWTSHRRFTETRVYVRPEGTFEFEYWLVPEIPAGGGPAETKVQYEFEVGLPWRTQLDFYVVSHEINDNGPDDGSMQFDEQKLEIRHALADWDEIWGNPTIYLEWAAIDQGSDHIEGKLLLGGEVTSSWHWGANGVWEHTCGGDQDNTYELTGGISKTLVDQRFSIGLESKLAYTDTKQDRGSYANEFLVGPSLQFRPVPRAHIDVSPLVGLTDESPDLKVLIVFGWEF